MTGFLIATALAVAYFLGAIPSAYIVGRFRKGTDIRQIGSRNMGAMKVFYNVGFRWGVLVLVMDAGKGAAAMAIALALGIPEVARFAVGIVAVLGHNFPVFLRFRGGKGGATYIGVLLVVMPWGITTPEPVSSVWCCSSPVSRRSATAWGCFPSRSSAGWPMTAGNWSSSRWCCCSCP